MMLRSRWVNRLTPRVLVGIFAVALVISGIQHYAKCQKLSRLGTQTRTAFLRWRTQILGDETPGRGPMPGLIKKDDVYRIYNYPNPPIMALILWPMAELPALTGAMLWFALKVLMALGILGGVWWLVRVNGPPISVQFLILAGLLSLHPIFGDLAHGNVNIFIAFLIVACLILHARGWSGLAGLTLALAIACKITPALFVPYYGWKWTLHWWDAVRGRTPWTLALTAHPARLLLGCVIGLWLWLLIVPGAILGADHNRQLLTSWYEVMAKPFLVEGKITSEHANQSIPGVVTRLLTAAPSDIGYDEEDKPFAADFHNLTDIGPEAARWVVRACQALWVLAVVGLCGSRERQGWKVGAETALVMLGMLLFSERTWKHHAVGLAMPLMVLAAFASRHWEYRRLRIVLWVGSGTVLALMGLPSVLGGKIQDEALAYGSHTLAFVLLTFGVVGALGFVQRNPSEPGQTSE